MALLEVSNLSKIYTTQGNVSVGISNINLMFDANEIVAITGESGSGKSTLLKVLGGLESYEEGELYFNGLPTSHYNNQDWADYLNNNISYIFQEYNILESFTVYENVMYALTSIKNLKERKKRALEIIEKVGLKDRIKTRGSKLSGGEKQRTVIARAIAKDAKIILADEPTGNLDTKTANDIVDLLKDIAKDKLVIVVTHNYEDFERITTRHIRLYNGKIQSDESIVEVEHVSSQKLDPFDFKEEHEVVFKSKKKSKEAHGSFVDVLSLGAKRFASRPKQNFLTAFLLIVAVLLIFITFILLIPSNDISGDIINQPGRMILVRKDLEPFYYNKALLLKDQLGAKEFILNDNLMDAEFVDNSNVYSRVYKVGFDLNYKLDVGHQVSKPGEIVLKVPYSRKEEFKLGDVLEIENRNTIYDYYGKHIKLGGKIVGISYYLEDSTVYVDMHKEDIQKYILSFQKLGDIYINCNRYGSLGTHRSYVMIDDTLKDNEIKLYSVEDVEGPFNFYFSTENLESYEYRNPENLEIFDKLDFKITGEIGSYDYKKREEYDNCDFMIKASESFYYDVYLNKINYCVPATQISFYFNTENEAINAANKLEKDNQGEYKIYLSKDYKRPKGDYGLPMGISIVVAIVVAILIVLSLIKIISASKSEISIYRTMGIMENVIKGSTYVQVILDTIPSILVLIASYFICYLTKLGQELFFMPPYFIAILAVAMLLIGIFVAFGFNKIIYHEKINKELRRTNK